jgi:hypothetical protein
VRVNGSLGGAKFNAPARGFRQDAIAGVLGHDVSAAGVKLRGSRHAAHLNVAALGVQYRISVNISGGDVPAIGHRAQPAGDIPGEKYGRRRWPGAP